MRIVCLFLLAIGAYAQDLPVIKYTTQQGLGHAVVYRIYEDKKGFLWFSTDNGLTRFDGENFKNFTEADGLRSSFIFGLTENDTTTILSTFGGGLQCTDGYTIDTVKSLAPNIRFPVSVLQHKNAIWVVDRNLMLSKITADTTKSYNQDIAYSTKKVISIFSFNDELYACSYGIYKYNTAKDKFESVNFNWETDYGFAFTNYAIPLDEENILINSQSILIGNFKTKELKSILSGNFSFSSRNMLKLNDGSVLIAEGNGKLWHLPPTLDAAKVILEGPVLNDMFQDKQGGIWLATYGQGVWYLPGLQIKTFAITGLISPHLNTINDTNVSVFSTSKRAIHIHPNASESFEDKSTKIEFNAGVRYFQKNKLTNETIIGNLATIIRIRGNMIDTLRFVSTQSTFLTDSKGNYWAGMRMGLVKVDASFTMAQPIKQFKDDIIRSLSDGFNETILVGTHRGLFLYNQEQQHQLKPIIEEAINDIVRDYRRNLFWIATNNGLFTLDGNNQVKKVFPDLRFNAITADKYGNLWGATPEGLLLYREKHFSILNRYSGIPNDLFDITYTENNDKLYVLSSTDVSVFEVGSWMAAYRPFPLKIIVSEQLADGSPIKAENKIRILPANTQSIVVQCSAGYGYSNHEVSMWYSVNDGPWVNAGKLRRLSFLQLPYGEFTVKLKFQDAINNTSSPTETLLFKIEKPFYRQLWAILLGSFLFITLLSVCIVLLYKAVIRAKIKKFIEDQRKSELEQKVLRNMLNPHFLNNAINSIQLFVTRNDQRKTLGYLSKFARLMQVNLELLESSRISLEKELKNIELYLEFEKLRFEGRLQYTITYANELSLTQWKVPSLVLQPFVENAIWHGILPKEKGGTVSIFLQEEDDILKITIEDDGIGLETSRANKQTLPGKTSRGTFIIAERFELLNHTKPGHALLVIDRKYDKIPTNGTKVIVTIPK
jgi:ligand-binding sensor domain-containing protein/anti-sigma regulatory factor (Ser/Thr protein kinase)